MGKLAALLVPLAIIGALFGTIIFILAPSSQAPCSVAAASRTDPSHLPTSSLGTYDAEQLRNAALIMNAAADAGMQHDAQIIALMAAIGQSNLTVKTYSSGTAAPDERGLFAQPGTGWGSLADRLDPTTSTRNFLKALAKVSGWQQLNPSVAAHRVTGNADPYFYSSFQLDATTIASTVSGQNGTCLAGDLVLPLSPGYNETDDFGPRTPIPGIAGGWHSGTDLQHASKACGDPILAITGGTVTVAAGYQISIKSPDGYTVIYMHMYPSTMLVKVGDSVDAGERIALTGDNGPATGCHLHVGIYMVGNTNKALDVLPLSQTLVGGASYPGYVDPEAFYALFGIDLCPSDTCRRLYK
jgi:murein DD-endopeptidase MepM/ murein hydrolase activator NlpD